MTFNVLLWGVQGLLALLFLFAGGKLVLPLEAMALLPLVVGALSSLVAYGRWRVAPIPGAARPRHDARAVQPVTV
jgi:hypothetical protein